MWLKVTLGMLSFMTAMIVMRAAFINYKTA
jgi:hypothetical protein